METYLRFVDRRARWILAALAVVTAFFVYQLTHLTYDSNPYLLDASHPARKTILDMQKEFGGTFDAVQFALYNKNGIYNRATLDAVLELTRSSRRLMLANDEDRQHLLDLASAHGKEHRAFAQLIGQILQGGFEQNDYFAAERLEKMGIEMKLPQAELAFLSYLPRRLNPVKAMASLAATDNILAQDGVLQATKPLRDKLAPPELIQSQVRGNEMMRGVVSDDGTVTQVVVEVALKQEDAEGQVRAYEAIERMISEYRRAHPEFRDEIYIAGASVAIAEGKRLSDHDLNLLFPLVVAVIGAILVAYFRRTLGVVLPLLNVVVSTIWTLGMMSLLRVPVDTITSILPVFLITICGADAIHMMNEYYEQKGSGITVKDAVRRTLREMFSPVVLTTVTTVVDFLFATSTNISSIRAFGAFMIVGLISAQIISLLLIPAWLNLTRDKPQATRIGRREGGKWFGQALEFTLNGVIRHRRAILWVFGALLVASGYMATRIVVEDAGSSYFKPDNAFRRSDEFINAHIAGTSPGWIRIEDTSADTILNTRAVSFIEELDNFIKSQPHVPYTYSLAGYIRRMHLVLNDMNPEYNRLPQTVETVRDVDPDTGKATEVEVGGDQLLSQLILMYQNGGGDELNYVLNRDGTASAMLFAMNTTRASEYKQFLDNLQAWLAIHKPANIKVTIAGTPVIWTGVLDEIVSGQVISIALALSSVCAVLMLWLRSAKEGLLAALPLAATTLLYYGLMSLAGIELNIGTALISFMVIGIVDYSVHYLHRIKSGLARGLSLDDALRYAIRHSGESIAFNVAVFSAGFLVLLFSDYTPIFNLGMLVALALFISGCMSLFLISLLAPWLLNRPVLAQSAPEQEASAA